MTIGKWIWVMMIATNVFLVTDIAADWVNSREAAANTQWLDERIDHLAESYIALSRYVLAANGVRQVPIGDIPAHSSVDVIITEDGIHVGEPVPLDQTQPFEAPPGFRKGIPVDPGDIEFSDEGVIRWADPGADHVHELEPIEEPEVPHVLVPGDGPMPPLPPADRIFKIEPGRPVFEIPDEPEDDGDDADEEQAETI